ncbi:MAG: MBOAT family protein [Oscillospiraceae bacterium]|nr:MBOAT family protein [Oscillospiraceae bacterium]
MVFSSYLFIFIFLPAVVLPYYLLSRTRSGLWQRLFLIAASLVYYGYDRPRYLLLLLGSIAVNYLLALGMQRASGGRRKAWLALGVFFNVALIGYYKYYNFFLENLNFALGTRLPLRDIALPLGISFFTFQQLSFLVSVYHGEERVGRLRDYCLFVSFFPQLVAGPIVLYSEMLPQFRDETRRSFDGERFASGLYMFSIGLFKKAVLADSLAVFADNGFGMTDLGLAAGWAVSLSYTLQIYFDFSGYSDMAVGLGRMFNIDIPMNFLSPYRSESISDFWRRWNLTLGRALSTYIYKPLGGNRKGLERTCLNLLLTFLVSGLWHGAAWTFVLWGGLHGVFAVLERLLGDRLKRIPARLRRGVTFLLVNALWVLFRAERFADAIEIYRGMLRFTRPGFEQIHALVGNAGGLSFPPSLNYLYLFGMLAVLLALVWRADSSAIRLKRFAPTGRSLAFAAGLFSIAVLCLSRESIFIYFNF